MFVDKSTPSTVTVARVSRFFSQSGVKNSDTLATVDSSLPPIAPTTQIDGYVLRMVTETGTWYYNGRRIDGSVLGWTPELRKAHIFPSRLLGDPTAQREAQDIRSLFGERAFTVSCLPVRSVPIGRCEIIQD